MMQGPGSKLHELQEAIHTYLSLPLQTHLGIETGYTCQAAVCSQHAGMYNMGSLFYSGLRSPLDKEAVPRGQGARHPCTCRRRQRSTWGTGPCGPCPPCMGSSSDCRSLRPPSWPTPESGSGLLRALSCCFDCDCYATWTRQGLRSGWAWSVVSSVMLQTASSCDCGCRAPHTRPGG